MDAALGDKASSAWPGKTVWADRISEADRERLSSLVPRDSQLAPNTWLSVFEDKSSPRPGRDEVYFAPSKQQEVVQPPPVIRTYGRSFPAPLDLILILIGGPILLIRFKRRRKLAS
jgi:hypothetical protein